jgi:hypothetical protein
VAGAAAAAAVVDKFNVSKKRAEMFYSYSDYETNFLNNEVNIKN